MRTRGERRTDLQPTPTENTVAFRAADFSTLCEALDYAALGQTGCNFYGSRGELCDILSYADLREQAVSLARKLLSLRLGRGARVAIIAETDPNFHRMYPGRSALTLVSLLFASVAEGLSLILLLPSLNLLTSDAVQGPGNALSGLGHTLTDALSKIGVTPTVGTLLIVILVCLALKAVFLLLANVQVGYTVAHVATDLQLSLLRSLLAARWEFYVRQPVGSLTNAIGTESLRASQAYLQGARTLVLLIQSIVFAGAAFFVTWKGALLSLAGGGLVLYALRRLVRMTHHAVRRTAVVARHEDRVFKALELALLGDC